MRKRDYLIPLGILCLAAAVNPALAEATSESSKPALGFNKNFYLESGDGSFRMDFFGYGQVRYTNLSRDEGDDTSEFTVQRARAGIKGHAFDKKLKYRLYLNVYSGSGSGTDLFDYWVQYSPGSDFGVRAGQWKVPYANSWNVSGSSQQFVDRSTVDANFRLDRDIGAGVSGKAADGKFSYDLGVFNGEGRNKRQDGDGHLFVGRAVLEPLGKFPKTETDLDKSETPRVKISVAVASNQELASHSRSNLRGRLTELGPSDVASENAYLGFVYRGFAAHAELHQREIDPLAAGLVSEDASGYYLQAGYFFDPGEIAVRVESFDPDDATNADSRDEIGVGFSWFLEGDEHKLSADLFTITTETAAGELEDTRFRLQWQLKF